MKNGWNQYSKGEGISVWTIAVYFLLVILKLFYENYDFSITDFSNFYISRATLDDVSVGKRVSFFYQSCALSLVLLPVLYYLAKRYFSHFPQSKSILAYLSTAGILMMVCDTMFYEAETSLKSLSILIILTGLLYPFEALRKVRIAWPILILTAFISTATILFLFNSSSFVTAQVETFFYILLIIFTGFYFLLNATLGVASRRVFVALSPLAVAPLLLFISIELDFLLREKYTWFSRQMFFLVALLISFPGAYFQVRKPRNNTSFLAERYFAPAALLAFVLLTFYHPFIDQPEDFFELANPANAQMLMFKFDKVPFIDFMTSHMLSEQWYGVFYHLIFGYDGSLDFLVYAFFNTALFYFLVFYFSKRIFFHWGPALLLAMLLPYLDQIFYVELFISVPALFACLHAVKHPTVKNHLLVALVLGVMIFWRLDTGVAALIATAIFLPLLYLVRQKVPSGKMLLKFMGIALIALFVLLLAAILMRSGETIYTNFLVALHYVSGNQAHGFSQIAREYNHHFFMILFLLPLVACLLIFLTVRRLFHSDVAEQHYSLKASLFFFLVFLSNFPRGLVRHGFLEALDGFYTSTFFLALALFAVSWLKDAKPFVRYSIFCFVSFTAFLTVKYFQLPTGKSAIETFFTQSTLLDLDEKMDETESRVRDHEAFAAEKYSDLKAFLDHHLNEDQTFLDFSNTPMLYFYTGREVPSYFAQSLQNSIDDYTQLNHLARLDTNRVPVVIFSHDPPTWMDATDGVANSMRYYPIAEYIYKNYRPAEVLNNLMVWLPKSQLEAFSLAYDAPLATPDYHYGYAPVYIYKHFEKESESLLKVQEIRAEGQFVLLNEVVRGESSLFLSLGLSGKGNDGLVVISLYSGDKNVGMLQLYASESHDKYMLPLTNSLSWHEFSPDRIKIEVWNGMELETVAFYKDLRIAD